MLTVAAAPASAGAGNNSSPSVVSQVTSNGQAVTPVAGGQTSAVADKKQCRHLPSSFSPRTQKVCLTAKEWAEVERDAQ